MNKKMPGIPESAQTEEKAREFLEATLWPNGPVCPHCKETNVYKMTHRVGSAYSSRKGMYRCHGCGKKFTVTVGTIFEGSHIPLHKWLMAVHFITASKKGFSAHQLHRMIGVTYKSAWFMCHRIRYSMKQDPIKTKLRGKVEVDETYMGGKNKNRPLSPRFREGAKRKVPVVALVSRSGKVRSFPVERVGGEQLKGAIRENVRKDATIYTDRWYAYTGIGQEYKGGHHTVNHSALQYARPGGIHTNTVESYFSLLKRGVMGTFHHVSKRHLARYCDEFAFRWNHKKVSDTERAIAAIKGTEGKRLMYKQPGC